MPSPDQHEPDHNLAWTVAQVEAAFVTSSPIKDQVIGFVDWWANLPTDGQGTDEVLEIVRKLVNGIDLDPIETTRRQRRWVPASQGIEHSTVGRVRPDFTHTDGWKLNGRVGEVVGIRRGDVILVFDQQVPGAPTEHRGPVGDFEIDLGHLDTEELS